ncbi:UvrB/UvrC motif-containing protein [Candidatus Peregrinibacteria bacterium]|nr:MAG: UvrB/UvrC motif-containing protein [Candidatus Peregrinibacteria bacterium]
MDRSGQRSRSSFPRNQPNQGISAQVQHLDEGRQNYIYIKITKEDFPQIQLVRKVEKDGARYFGPKTAAGTVRKTLMLLQKLFMFRSCDLGITWTPDSEFPEKGLATVTKKTIAYPCLDYHIKRCAAPCIGKITPEDYKKSIDKISLFLEGKSSEIEQQLKDQMALCAAEKQFEKAALLRDKLLALQELMVPNKQVVTSPEQDSMDVFAFVLEGGKAYFNLFMLREGKLINQENFIADAFGFEPGEEEQAVEVMEAFLYQYYGKATDFPKRC